MAAAPEIRGSLGIVCIEDGNERASGEGRRKFFKIEFSGFFQVGERFFDAATLADRAALGAIGDIEIAFLAQDRGKRAYWHCGS